MAAEPTVYFVSHGGAIKTAIGSTAFGPFTAEADAMVTATRLSTVQPAQVYAATLLMTVAPPAPKLTAATAAAKPAAPAAAAAAPPAKP